MLDAKELARRVREAMDGASPPVISAALANRCGVSPQAVSGWRKDGRIAKRHLLAIAEMTGQSLAYFLEDKPTKPEITMPIVEFKRGVQDSYKILQARAEENRALRARQEEASRKSKAQKRRGGAK